MGKLIERLKNAYMGSNFSEDAHWSDDGKEFLEIVEEMYKEFPRKIAMSSGTILLPNGKSQKHILFDYDVEEIIQWFEKWFGESDG